MPSESPAAVPTRSPESGIGIVLPRYALTYHIENEVDPVRSDYVQITQQTDAFLREYMEQMLDDSVFAEFKDFVTEYDSSAVEPDGLIMVTYKSKGVFGYQSILLPREDQLVGLVADAFSGESLVAYISQLQEMPVTSSFSTTTDVTYSATVSNNASVYTTKAAITAATLGMFLLAFSIFKMKTRRRTLLDEKEKPNGASKVPGMADWTSTFSDTSITDDLSSGRLTQRLDDVDEEEGLEQPVLRKKDASVHVEQNEEVGYISYEDSKSSTGHYDTRRFGSSGSIPSLAKLFSASQPYEKNRNAKFDTRSCSSDNLDARSFSSEESKLSVSDISALLARTRRESNNSFRPCQRSSIKLSAKACDGFSTVAFPLNNVHEAVTQLLKESEDSSSFSDDSSFSSSLDEMEESVSFGSNSSDQDFFELYFLNKDEREEMDGSGGEKEMGKTLGMKLQHTGKETQMETEHLELKGRQKGDEKKSTLAREAFESRLKQKEEQIFKRQQTVEEEVEGVAEAREQEQKHEEDKITLEEQIRVHEAECLKVLKRLQVERSGVEDQLKKEVEDRLSEEMQRTKEGAAAELAQSILKEDAEEALKMRLAEEMRLNNARDASEAQISEEEEEGPTEEIGCVKVVLEPEEKLADEDIRLGRDDGLILRNKKSDSSTQSNNGNGQQNATPAQEEKIIEVAGNLNQKDKEEKEEDFQTAIIQSLGNSRDQGRVEKNKSSSINEKNSRDLFIEGTHSLDSSYDSDVPWWLPDDEELEDASISHRTWASIGRRKSHSFQSYSSEIDSDCDSEDSEDFSGFHSTDSSTTNLSSRPGGSMRYPRNMR